MTLIHRRDELRSEKILQNRLFAHEKIDVVWDHQLDEVLGGGMPPTVTGARLKNVKTGETTDMDVDGIFIAIGHAPETGLFKDQLDLKPNGYIWTAPDSTATSVPGVFAAGSVPTSARGRAPPDPALAAAEPPTASATSLTVAHSWQAGHRPVHVGCSAPQARQTWARRCLAMAANLVTACDSRSGRGPAGNQGGARRQSERAPAGDRSRVP